MKDKILLGFSGGVDSAISAYLLKKDGYDVTGCFMRNWDSITNNDIYGNPSLTGSKCSQELDYDDAKLAASQLGINLMRVDFIEDYWEKVFMYFLDEYKQGRTPNPDVFCNRYIKFDSFRKYAHEHGFNHIAMGHYAKKIVSNDGEAMLYKAKDLNKDQSYFLSEITYEQLNDTYFPLGDITKIEVRKLASELGLSIANKKDSTGVCFIGERRFKEFLANYLPAKKGDIVDIVSNRVIGSHTGVLYYTVGQHRGLNIGGIIGYKNEPFFVVGKDVSRNILYVAQEDNKYMYSYKCRLNRFNWLLNKLPNQKFKCLAKFRYRGLDMPVEVEYVNPDEVYIIYDKYKYIAKGQVCVLYNEDGRCLGGGTIIDTYNQDGSKIEY